MLGSSMTLFPLEGVSESDLKKLCVTLWDWKFCIECQNAQPCVRTECPWQRSKNLKSFFRFYRNVTSWNIPEVPVNTHHALRSHDDLFRIIQLLKEKSEVPRSDLTKEYFLNCGKDDELHITDQHRAFNLAVRVMTMINCSVENQSLVSETVVWRNDKSLQEFMASTFPMREHPSLSERDLTFSDVKRLLTAKRLKEIAGLKLEGTDDLKNHLHLDQKTGILQIYHHTSVLKEHLMATRGSDQVQVSADSVLRGIIPRQLALETLDSLQDILFPLDHEHRKLLRSLVSKNHFDPDCPHFGPTDYRRDNEKEIVYHYWGSRLIDLYDEIENPKPRGLLQEMLEMKSRPRHVMMATIAGVIIAIVLGVLGLAVGIFQAWISYQQWKYAVSNMRRWARKRIDV